MPYYLPDQRRWVYPPIEAALEIAGLYPMEEYILRRRMTIHGHVEQRPIYMLCKESTRLHGSPSGTKYWWDQSMEWTEE